MKRIGTAALLLAGTMASSLFGQYYPQHEYRDDPYGDYQGIYAPPPPPLPRYAYNRPPMPAPDYRWVDGYWSYNRPRYVWVKGYWARPPYAGGYWVAPRYNSGRFFVGFWGGGRPNYRNHGFARGRR